MANAKQPQLLRTMGCRSLFEEADKQDQSGLKVFGIDGYDLPFVAGRSACLHKARPIPLHRAAEKIVPIAVTSARRSVAQLFDSGIEGALVCDL
ncbi:hypothetical protein CS8_043630 [Cupriavidus sp. 8B]